LEYGQLSYKEDFYVEDDDWFPRKPDFRKNGYFFPNLPYLQTDKFKITQSKAIIHHLGRTLSLYPKTEEDFVRVEMFENEIEDLRTQYVDMIYGDRSVLVQPFLNLVAKKLPDIESFLLANDKSPWCIKDLTYVDFFAVEVLYAFSQFDSKILSSFPRLTSYIKDFHNLPKIKEYESSNRYIKTPINGVD